MDAVREAKEVTNRAVLEAKEVSIDTTVATLKVGQHPSYTLAQLQAREADVRALADLSRSLDKKVSNYTSLNFACFTFIA